MKSCSFKYLCRSRIPARGKLAQREGENERNINSVCVREFDGEKVGSRDE